MVARGPRTVTAAGGFCTCFLGREVSTRAWARRWRKSTRRRGAVFSTADGLLGISLGELCFEGPEERLTDTINAQPALFASSMAAMCALQEEVGDLPRPVFFAGHSMGEYSALAAAGCISFADGLRLVRERGRLMKEAGARRPGRMGGGDWAGAGGCGRDLRRGGEAARRSGHRLPTTTARGSWSYRAMNRV